MRSKNRRRRELCTWLLAILLPAALAGCGLFRRQPQDKPLATDAEGKPDGNDPSLRRMRPQGKADLPFWYSDKSKEIEASLGGSR